MMFCFWCGVAGSGWLSAVGTVVGSASAAEERVDLGREFVRELEEEAVVGVGVDQELRVRDAVRRACTSCESGPYVVVAVRHERGNLDVSRRSSLESSGIPHSLMPPPGRHGPQVTWPRRGRRSGEDPARNSMTLAWLASVGLKNRSSTSSAPWTSFMAW